VGEIWVSVNGAEQKLFAQEVKGSSVANWIGPGEKADFVLYSGLGRQKEIAKVTVAHTK
jgi:flagellar basal body rod protein FlgF